MRTLAIIMFGLAALLLAASFVLWVTGVWGDTRAVTTGWITAAAAIVTLITGAAFAAGAER